MDPAADGHDEVRLKFAQDGRPVYFEQLGNIDLAEINKITSAERMLQNLVVEYEKLVDPRLPACSRKAGQLLETCCSVMDLKGVGISKISSVYSYVKSASAISQNYYPERLGKLYLINAPWGFASAFSVVKGFLDPVTVQKINILGAGYLPELLKQIPSENIPTMFGGTCECEQGCPFSDKGPWQDPEWSRPPKWAGEKPESRNATQNELSSTKSSIVDPSGALKAAQQPDEQKTLHGISPQMPMAQ